MVRGHAICLEANDTVMAFSTHGHTHRRKSSEVQYMYIIYINDISVSVIGQSQDIGYLVAASLQQQNQHSMFGITVNRNSKLMVMS